VRICIIYDCLYPHTVGGAERWYRNLAQRLAQEGHEVTYLTMRQWDATEEPDVDEVHVVAVAPRMPLYTGDRRRILPPLVFGAGVLWHLLLNRRSYDVIHTASFPYFSLLAAAPVRHFASYRLFVDWHELWTRDYWRKYLGPLGGRFGWSVQQLCLRVPQRAFCFSRLVERRLLAEGVGGEVTVLEGQFEGMPADAPLPPEPLVVFAGRHIPEKNPLAVVHAVLKARQTIPELRAVIYGDGPDRPKVLAAIAEHGLEEIIEAPGFVDEDVVQSALTHALCLVLPSTREGYGLVVLEALSRGTPVVLVRGDDNAAAEFLVERENGLLLADARPETLGAAIVLIRSAGWDLRWTTLKWFVGNYSRLSLDASLDLALREYLDA
jgi:glycosyltransferase involved in cell wall biosynthesis